jgi:hypothetical protein
MTALCDAILFGLLVWVCYNAVRVVQDLWAIINQTFPRRYTGEK